MDAEPHITHRTPAAAAAAGPANTYAARFAQGATVVPRMLFLVDVEAASPIGAGAGRRGVRSRRTASEKQPWKKLEGPRGTVESQFIRNMYLGDSVLPYRTLDPTKIVIPYDGKRLIGEDLDRLDDYPGLANWWRSVESTWDAHRSSDRLTLQGRLDYQRGLSQQFPAAPVRVVYSASGMYLAASIVTDPLAVIEHKLYWGSVNSTDEALYLLAIFNSDALTQAVRPLQGRGEHNPRDFDKYVFQVPFPQFDPDDPAHRQLVDLAAQAQTVAESVVLADVRFESLRRHVREAVAAAGVAAQIDALVAALISTQA